MPWINLSEDLVSELKISCMRTSSDKLSRFGSFEGRVYCVINCGAHAVSIILKPLMYLASSVITVAMMALYKRSNPEKFVNHPEIYRLISRPLLLDYYFYSFAPRIALCSLTAPIGQIIQLAKAFAGIFHPGAYYQPNVLEQYCNALAGIAKKVGCSQELVIQLRKENLLDDRLSFCPYYYDLYKHNLKLMLDKFSDPTYPTDQTLELLTRLEPHSKTSDAISKNGYPDSGINACSAGLARLLEQICCSLDIPADPTKVIPCLMQQNSEEMISLIAMRAREGKKNLARHCWYDRVQACQIDETHQSNLIIFMIGEEIGLPQDVINKAGLDPWLELISDEFKQELLEEYHELSEERPVMQYLLKRINSNPEEGTRGLEAFRLKVIQSLADAVTDEELESSKEQIQNELKVDALADDPFIFVRYHYHLDHKDDKKTDLNEKAIRAYSKYFFR